MTRRFGRPSIYEHIRAHVDPEGVGLLEGGEDLPDEDDRAGELRWVAGGLEGAFYRYAGGGDEDADDEREREAAVAELHSALVRVADSGRSAHRRELLALFRRYPPREFIDPLLERLRAYPPRDVERLYVEVRSIFLRTRHRDELKFAVALLGMFGRAEDAELFRTLARHEEFTLYAAVAVAHVVEDPVPEWLELIRHVTLWGKTELSELLARHDAERACPYLLRHGLSVGNALTLARECRLHDVLEDDVDDELLDGAGDILGDLAGGLESPETLFDYPEAAVAVERFLVHLEPRASTLRHFLVVDDIREQIELDSPEDRGELEEFAREEGLGDLKLPDEEEHARQLAEAGFDSVRTARVLDLCQRILDRPQWRELAEGGLAIDDDGERWEAFEVARRLGVPLHDAIVEGLERDPHDDDMWFRFCSGADEARIEEALVLAERLLDVASIGTGPTDALILPPSEYPVHSCVEYVLQELPRFPGKGWSVIRPALRSPVVRQRLAALRSLSAWAEEDLPAGSAAAVTELLKDPVDDVRRAAAAVLAGEPIPEPSLDDVRGL